MNCAPHRSGSCGSRRPVTPCPLEHENGGVPRTPPFSSSLSRLGAADLDFEWFVGRLHRVGHINTDRGAGDLVGASVLFGLGLTLARVLLESQRDTVDVAEADRMNGWAVACADNGPDTSGGIADCDVDVLAHRAADDSALHGLVLAIDRHSALALR